MDNMSGEYPPITQHLTALDNRLERIETKLDDHLGRVAKAETDLHWLKGHVKLATTVFLAVVGFLGTVLLNLVIKVK